MTLYEKLEQIQRNEKIGVNDFISRTGMSRGMYYKIKDGTKTELKPVQAKAISDAFASVSYDWLMSKTTEDAERSEEIFIEIDGAQVSVSGIAKVFADNPNLFYSDKIFNLIYARDVAKGVNEELSRIIKEQKS